MGTSCWRRLLPCSSRISTGSRRSGAGAYSPWLRRDTVARSALPMSIRSRTDRRAVGSGGGDTSGTCATRGTSRDVALAVMGVPPLRWPTRSSLGLGPHGLRDRDVLRVHGDRPALLPLHDAQ